MRIFAISDLHLSGVQPKPMEIFGGHWQNHMERIEDAWRDKITNEDVVLIAGDISWAMNVEDAAVDLKRIEKLPGEKVLIKGNHDYWWNSLTRVKNIAGAMKVIQNDAVKIGDVVFCGSRGWLLPDGKDYTAEDAKIFQRELLRLEMSLKCAAKLTGDGGEIIALTHYPPFSLDADNTCSEVTGLLERYDVKTVVYGHMHGKRKLDNNCREINGIHYYVTSCDLLGFEPIRIK